MTDATSPDFEKRKALSEEIRRACMTAGFFYGASLLHCSYTTLPRRSLHPHLSLRSLTSLLQPTASCPPDYPPALISIDVEKLISVTNSGVDESIVNAQFEASKAFFHTPTEVKKSVAIKPDNLKGYMGLLAENVAPTENKGDYHAAFNMGIDPECGPQMGIPDMPERHGAYGPNTWPKQEDWEGAEEFKKTTLAYL